MTLRTVLDPDRVGKLVYLDAASDRTTGPIAEDKVPLGDRATHPVLKAWIKSSSCHFKPHNPERILISPGDADSRPCDISLTL